VIVLRSGLCRSILPVIAAGVLVVLVGTAPAHAASEKLVPWWSLTSGSRPSELPAEGVGEVVVTAQDVGDADAVGGASPVKIVDVLPEGLEAVGIEGIAGGEPPGGHLNRGSVSCSLKTLTCIFSGTLPAYEQIEVVVSVKALAGASSGEENAVSVSGGGATGIKMLSRPISVGDALKFGIEEYRVIPENVGGSIDTQAGSHPFQISSVLTLNQTFFKEGRLNGEPGAVALPKDLVGELPAGLVGNPTPIKQCTQTQFDTKIGNAAGAPNECPQQTVVGVTTVAFTSPDLGFFVATQPIFNLEPLAGEPARFGFEVAGVVPVYLDASVRTGGDYGVTLSSSNIIQIDSLKSFKLTFWGVPGDPRHNDQRGQECLNGEPGCEPLVENNPPAFLMMPTSCEQPFETTAQGDSWAAAGIPSERAEPVTYRLPVGLDGCNHLPFSPRISVAPDVPDASTPTGLTVDVHVPQESALYPEGLAESSVKNITVALPEGVAVNPAGADGLEACSEDQIGYLPSESAPPSVLRFTPDLGEPFCANGSKIGMVTIHTPLLPNPLQGAVYLASQDANPFGSLIAMYVVAQDSASGTLVKLPGQVHSTETGQLITTFEDNPELPFEDAELHFFGGERAPLATPAHCGTYTTTSSLAPWSGNAPSTPSSTFQITSGPNGSSCPGAVLPFSPTLASGTMNINAGAFTPLTTTLSREDGQQSISSVTLHYPSGVSGLLSGVKLCGEAQANAGTCGAESEIGETVVSVGLGGDPFSVTGGKVYITGPYRGAPFGLSIVNPAKAGPFDLQEGRPVVVRAKIEVDPHTAALTITTDPPGSPHAIPTIIEGIPLQIKHVNVLVNRPGFTFNPTNCDPQTITGAVDSAEGASSPVSDAFQVTNCASLKFAPKFAVSTSAKTSKADGVTLSVKLSYPDSAQGAFDGPEGDYTNIARVKVELPKQLPSRLDTLQKACPSAQFEANPAGCPAASIVGHAKATTPLIPVPLEGPAYFVSHGGEAFPSLIIVLQGYGVTVDLVGSTFINEKTGVTSSTFKTVPDAPVGSFELTLPEGRYSALAANTNLCKTKLAMPTEFLAQNGAEIHEITKIAVTGCPKAKKSSKHKRKHTRSKRKKK
jgi:hypothetical protein